MKSMVYVCFLDDEGDAAVIHRELFDRAKAEGLIPPSTEPKCEGDVEECLMAMEALKVKNGNR